MKSQTLLTGSPKHVRDLISSRRTLFLSEFWNDLKQSFYRRDFENWLTDRVDHALKHIKKCVLQDEYFKNSSYATLNVWDKLMELVNPVWFATLTVSVIIYYSSPVWKFIRNIKNKKYILIFSMSSTLESEEFMIITGFPDFLINNACYHILTNLLLIRSRIPFEWAVVRILNMFSTGWRQAELHTDRQTDSTIIIISIILVNQPPCFATLTVSVIIYSGSPVWKFNWNIEKMYFDFFLGAQPWNPANSGFYCFFWFTRKWSTVGSDKNSISRSARPDPDHRNMCFAWPECSNSTKNFEY